jgi:DNA repair protein RadC
MSKITPIPMWQNFDKPREKMIQVGPKYLSDSELIALVINNGNKRESALDISRKMLAKSKDGLNGLAQIDFSGLQAHSGI